MKRPIFETRPVETSRAIKNALKCLEINGVFNANNRGDEYPVQGWGNIQWDELDMIATLDGGNIDVRIEHRNEFGRLYRGFGTSGKYKIELGEDDDSGRYARIDYDAPRAYNVSPWKNEIDFILCIFGTGIMSMS